MPKLTADDIVPGELYVFTNPAFSRWVGVVVRAIGRYERSNAFYVFKIIELTDGIRSLGYAVGRQLPLKVNFFERYPCVQSASDQLFN